MPVKIRLQRGGRKRNPIYKIVVADSRSKRDGKFIEKLGTFDPNIPTNQVSLNFDSAVAWYMKGAQPTETARTILSNEGVLLKKHLLMGVQKGALTEDDAEKKFQAWLDDKNSKDESLNDAQAKAAADKAKAAAAERAKIKEDMAAAAAAEAAAIVKAEEAEAAAEEVVEEAPTEEVVAEEIPAEEAAPEAEAPSAEATEKPAE